MHNCLRDRVHACAANAGVVAQTEVPNLLPDSHERPGDVVMVGVGAGGRDLVIDVTVVDYLSSLDAISNAELEKREKTVGAVAEKAQKLKRNARGGAINQTMEERVRAQGKQFRALGFETTGATTSSCSALLKRLSEIAAERRGHHKSTFLKRWIADWSMVIAKRGAQAGLARAYTVAVRCRVGYILRSDGPLLSEDAEPYIYSEAGA